MLAANVYLWWAAQVVAILILVVLFLRWRPGFLGGRTIATMVGALLDARAEAIRQQLSAAERSREEAARIREQAAQEIERARQESAIIVQRAAGTSEAIRHEIEVRAREEYERIIDQARGEIQYERERAEMALQRRAADIVVDAAEQVIERNLQPQTDRRIIDQSLDHLRQL